MSLTQQRRALFSALSGERRRLGLSAHQVARATGARLRDVELLDSDPELADPPLDFVLRYAHFLGVQLVLRAEAPSAADGGETARDRRQDDTSEPDG